MTDPLAALLRLREVLREDGWAEGSLAVSLVDDIRTALAATLPAIDSERLARALLRAKDKNGRFVHPGHTGRTARTEAVAIIAAYEADRSEP